MSNARCPDPCSLTWLAVGFLLVQCFWGLMTGGMLADVSAGPHAQNMPALQSRAQPVAGIFSETELAATAQELISADHQGSMNRRFTDLPVMSCCEDEVQPLILTELQLLPFLLLCLLTFIPRRSLSVAPQPQRRRFSRIPLHQLQCRWLH